MTQMAKQQQEDMALPDIQATPDMRNMPIQRVGICDWSIPLAFEWQAGVRQMSVAKVALSVALSAEQKGTHMSRFVELFAGVEALTLAQLLALHAQMLTLLRASEGSIVLDLPIFRRKQAPVTGVEGVLDYRLQVAVDGGESPTVALTLTVPVTSLCPCSKEISKYGAHNQRSHVVIWAQYEQAEKVDIESLIVLAEAQGSCEIWSALKRPDERYVTERAYENPKFVEDIVRDVALAMKVVDGVVRYRVSCENFESIHNHSAYAVIEGLGQAGDV